MRIEIRWNRTPRQILDRILDDAAMTYAHTRLHAYCSDYVPMDSGALDQTVDITPEYVHYKSPYAHFQWEGKKTVIEFIAILLQYIQEFKVNKEKQTINI